MQVQAKPHDPEPKAPAADRTTGPVATVEGGFDPFSGPPFATQTMEADGVYRLVVGPGDYVLDENAETA